jgi:hypothetical protein
MKIVTLFPILFALVVGCNYRPLKPGTTGVTTSANGMHAELKQPENPAQTSAQDIEETVSEKIVIPPGARVAIPRTQSQTNGTSTNAAAPSTDYANWFLADKPVTIERTTKRSAGTKIGAAQKDTARELQAKLASVRWISWVGIVFVAAGIFSFTQWGAVMMLPVRAKFGLIIAGGVLVFAPMVIAGNEALIICIVVGCGIAWFLYEKYHESNTERAYLKGKLDANGDGVDDRVEGILAGIDKATTRDEINAALVTAKNILEDNDYAVVKAAADKRRLEIK